MSKHTLRKPLNELTASEIAAAVGSGNTTCEAVAQACLEHIGRREPEVQAWQHLDPEQVLAQARALDRADTRRPLAGVPFGAKDIMDTCDMPTEYGSPIYKGHRPRNDAACIALARRAGALLLGKTVSTEFANVYPGKTRNPFDRSRTPGGSSSGSAAAVGDHHVPLALGTQTSGSTLRPAAFCGVFGFRPTHGDVRCAGVKEAAGSLDTVGPIARSVEDIALFRDVLLGIDPQPLPETGAPRIGFCRTHLWSKLEPYTQRLLEDAARQLAATGAKVKELALPSAFERIEDAHRWISSFEFTRNFAWEIDNHWDGISEALRSGRIKDGLSCTYERYIEARTFAERERAAASEIFADSDVLLAPVALGEAPIGLSSTGNAAPCTLWTTLHVPALSIPLGKGPNGLPVGAQLVARRNDDRKLLCAARWIHSHLT